MGIKEIGIKIRRGPSGRGGRHERGAALVLIVFAIVVIAVIGAAIYGVVSTGTLNQTIAQQATKAYYLAESGVRIAAGEWNAATEATRNTRMANLDGQTFVMPGNSGQLTVSVYPAWLYATAAYSAGATSLTLRYPGELPLLDKEGTVTAAFPSRGLLRLKGKTVPAYFTSAPTAGTRTIDGTPVTFTGLRQFWTGTPNGFKYDIEVGNELFIGFAESSPGISIFYSSAVSSCGYPGLNADIDEGDCIVLNNAGNQAQLFPPENGNFYINIPEDAATSEVGAYYRYTRRIINDDGTATLTNIQQGIEPTRPTFQLRYDSGNLYDNNGTTQIYITGGMGFRSTSIYGN